MSSDCIKLELLQLTQVQLTRDCAGIKMFLGVCCSEHDSMHGCSVGPRGRLAIEPLVTSLPQDYCLNALFSRNSQYSLYGRSSVMRTAGFGSRNHSTCHSLAKTLPR